MYRLAVLFGVLILSFAAIVPGFCQGIPGCYPQTFPTINPCMPSRPAPPISRTVQVDVPVPCVPSHCGPAVSYPPNPCGPLVCAPPYCAPPQPTRPVQVRVDVVVRTEKPQPCVPQRFCCENPPVFEPFFCQGARMIQSLLVLPLCIGERLMGHPVPTALPPATPIPCWRMCAPTGPVCVQPPPVSQCMPPAQCAPTAPVAKCGIPERPVSKMAPCRSGAVKPFPSHGNFPR
jgi:hypothetical protein